MIIMKFTANILHCNKKRNDKNAKLSCFKSKFIDFTFQDFQVRVVWV